MTEENSTPENTAPEAEQPKPRRGRPPKPKTEEPKVELEWLDEPEIVERPEPRASIGRIVRYVTGQGTIRPAIISALVEEDEVQLTVFNSQGAVFADNVPFAPEDAAVPGTYHWPTFD